MLRHIIFAKCRGCHTRQDRRYVVAVHVASQRKKVTAAFDGGRITSDVGVVLLAEAERRLGLADKLAAVIADGRDPTRVIRIPPVTAAFRLASWSGILATGAILTGGDCVHEFRYRQKFGWAATESVVA